jgi:hypothetical protein
MGVVFASGTTFPFGCANMTKWSMHACRVYIPVLFMLSFSWACPSILVTILLCIINIGRYTPHVNRPVVTDYNWFSSVLYKFSISKTATDYE